MSPPKSRLDAESAASRRELVEQQAGGEDVDAHAGERRIRLVRHAGRVGGLLEEISDAVAGVNRHDAEAARLQPRHLDAADRDVGAALDVLRPASTS